jgi:ABC-type metal ion transport system, ATPase component
MIKLTGICKTFTTKDKEVQALKNINLTIDEGDIFGVIGYSGAGKSTLIRIINLLEEPDSGEVEVDGISLRSINKKQLRSVRTNIGMIFQGFNLMNSIDVCSNIAAPLKNLGWKKADIEEKVNSMLKLVGLEDKKHAYPNQLSGGQKQRVAIARALSSNPKILLCDEATSALDPNTTQSILELLKQIHEQLKITIVIITHQMEVVRSICNRIAIMEDGVIVEQGDIIDIFSNPQSDIAKDFVYHSIGVSVGKEDFSEFKGRICKFNFFGKIAHEPVLSRLERKFGIQVNILYGNIENLHNSIVGSLIVELIGDSGDIDKALDFYRTLDTRVEVIRDAAAANS